VLQDQSLTQTKGLHSHHKSVSFGVPIAIGQATKRFVRIRLNSCWYMYSKL